VSNNYSITVKYKTPPSEEEFLTGQEESFENTGINDLAGHVVIYQRFKGRFLETDTATVRIAKVMMSRSHTKRRQENIRYKIFPLPGVSLRCLPDTKRTTVVWAEDFIQFVQDFWLQFQFRGPIETFQLLKGADPHNRRCNRGV